MRFAVCSGIMICALAAPALGQQAAPAAVPVGTVVAERKPIAKSLDYVGRVEAVNRVQIVARVKGFLVEQGVPEAALDTKAFGNQHNLTAEEVKSAVEQNPEITKEERARFLRNITVIKWASNRRVDVTLNTGTGQTETSVRQYPFNAADSLALIGGREADRKAAAAKKAANKPAAKKPAAKKPTKK